MKRVYNVKCYEYDLSNFDNILVKEKRDYGKIAIDDSFIEETKDVSHISFEDANRAAVSIACLNCLNSEEAIEYATNNVNSEHHMAAVLYNDLIDIYRGYDDVMIVVNEIE